MVAALACLPLPALGQSDEELARSQLKELQRDIKRINQEISAASSRKNTLQGQLRSVELALAKLQRSIAGNRKNIAAQRSELEPLHANKIALQAKRDEQQERIAVELRTAWKMGQQGQVKVLLNQESPHTVTRAMAYYRYFFKARNELLDEYRGTLHALEETQATIDQTLRDLALHQQELTEQEQRLARGQSERQIAIAKLSDSISGKGARLKKLEQDQKELEKLLGAIEEAIVNLEVPTNYQAFGSAKGRMPWPVAGKASNRFGRSRNDGKMRWQGVTIPTKAGTPVQAIHHGRVVYADWLRGMGLLLIIDHGDGYMSLYAHNQTLLREVGEWVTSDTAVSTAGSSGGQEASALYFEIRHRGKPINPAKWCRR